MKLIFDQKAWHACSKEDWKTCDNAVNCYSYALNNPKFYWSQPGMGYIKTKPQPYIDSFNNYFKDYTLREFMDFMKNGAISDGMIQVNEPVTKEGYYLIALFFKDHPSNFDLHWYRQDDNGSWSHKDGWAPISNRDAAGNIIKDPRQAVHPDYPIFGSFFLVPRKGIVLKKRFPIQKQYI